MNYVCPGMFWVNLIRFGYWVNTGQVEVVQALRYIKYNYGHAHLLLLFRDTILRSSLVSCEQFIFLIWGFSSW